MHNPKKRTATMRFFFPLLVLSMPFSAISLAETSYEGALAQTTFAESSGFVVSNEIIDIAAGDGIYYYYFTIDPSATNARLTGSYQELNGNPILIGLYNDLLCTTITPTDPGFDIRSCMDHDSFVYGNEAESLGSLTVDLTPGLYFLIIESGTALSNAKVHTNFVVNFDSSSTVPQGNSAETSPSTPATVPGEDAQTDVLDSTTFLTYENADLGFSIDYPSDWQTIAHPSGRGIGFFSSQYAATVAVDTYPLLSDPLIDEYAWNQIRIKDMSEKVPGFVLLGSQPTVLDGNPAYYIMALSQTEQEEVFAIFETFTKGDDDIMYTVTYFLHPQTSTAAAPIVAEMISSLEIDGLTGDDDPESDATIAEDDSMIEEEDDGDLPTSPAPSEEEFDSGEDMQNQEETGGEGEGEEINRAPVCTTIDYGPWILSPPVCTY
jgi:PsbP-like protein